MANYDVPCMGQREWLKSDSEIIDYLLACYFTVRQRQSYTSKTVTSVQYRLYENRDVSSFCKRIEEDLTDLYRPYFDTVQVDVMSDEDKTLTEAVTVTVNIRVSSKGMTTSANRLVQQSDSRMQWIINENDTGDYNG